MGLSEKDATSFASFVTSGPGGRSTAGPKKAGEAGNKFVDKLVKTMEHAALNDFGSLILCMQRLKKTGVSKRTVAEEKKRVAIVGGKPVGNRAMGQKRIQAVLKTPALIQRVVQASKTVVETAVSRLTS